MEIYVARILTHAHRVGAGVDQAAAAVSAAAAPPTEGRSHDRTHGPLDRTLLKDQKLLQGVRGL